MSSGRTKSRTWDLVLISATKTAVTTRSIIANPSNRSSNLPILLGLRSGCEPRGCDSRQTSALSQIAGTVSWILEEATSHVAQ